MTYENYNEIKNELIEIQKKIEHDDDTLEQFMHAIVDRAWTQPKFTPLYANLCQELASNSKQFKLKVVQTVSNEYYNAFSEFYELVINLELPDKPHAYEEEKFEKYLKRKNKLLGNIALIAELYKKKFLPHKIIRYICCNLIDEMIIYHQKVKEFEFENGIKLEFPFQEEFIECMIKLLDLGALEMLSSEEEQYAKLVANVEADKQRRPDLESMFREDLEFKKQKIADMLAYVEKKVVKKAPKYFSEYDEFPLKQEDLPKYNCMYVSIEFLRNCDRFGFSEKIVSLVLNLFDKLAKTLRTKRVQVKSCKLNFCVSVNGVEIAPRLEKSERRESKWSRMQSSQGSDFNINTKEFSFKEYQEPAMP
jgi:hypothetical protein